MQQGDYYSILGVPSSASVAEIRKAYYRLAQQYHPDKNPSDPTAGERFRIISEAYQVLSDEGKRAAYDLKNTGSYFHQEVSKHEYLHVEVDLRKVKLNEEVELIYSFPGDGRFFRKPPLHGWSITSGPTVDHRFQWIDGSAVRETVLHYTICPLTSGTLTIPAATIQFHRHPVSSDALTVFVEQNECFFSPRYEAGGNPCRVMMHRAKVTTTKAYRKTVVHQRTILIPRSELAAWYHKVGRTMKIVFLIFGTAWALAQGESPFVGAFAGSLLGGVNVHIMYRLMGIKSVFYYAHLHPLVKEYENYGYQIGAEPNEGLLSARIWNLLKSLIV